MLFGRNGDGDTHLQFYVDGAFAVHADAKSHEGLVVVYGGSCVLAWSKKQKICTKDSTESELVGVTDFIPQMEWVKDFLTGQGEQISKTTLYQDNTSTMKIIDNPDCGKLRSRYIKARAGAANEFVHVRGEVAMEHICTEYMVADVLTKPLMVEEFSLLEERLMNNVLEDEFRAKVIERQARKSTKSGILAATFFVPATMNVALPESTIISGDPPPLSNDSTGLLCTQYITG